MGKKKEKKGKGAEKTQQKTEKKSAKKAKKDLAATGEEDIESLIAEFTAKDKHRNEIAVEKSPPPSPRLYSSFVAHPSRDELLLYGGEFDNGNKTTVYGDLFSYNLKKQHWMSIRSPGAPPPRCSHQAVITRQAGGQMWVFGGEFVSPSQNQFYHYKDLWSFSLSEHKWTKVPGTGGPSARSGHRMVLFRKLLLVFGGFHDNNRECKYYNDVHAFSLESYKWEKLDVSGTAPAPRSACKMCVVQEGSGGVLVYGGFSKAKGKKEADRGVVHIDMFKLSPTDKSRENQTPLQWRWSPVKQSGWVPAPRTNFELVPISGDRAVLFGGVRDEEDADDDTALKSVFYNDSYFLNMTSGKWHELALRGPDGDGKRKARRRRKLDEEEEPMDTDGAEDKDDDATMEVTEEEATGMTTTYDDGIFKVTVAVGGTDSTSAGSGGEAGEGASGGGAAPMVPRPRMNAAVAVRDGMAYMYGGMFEQKGDEQVTMDDFYSLNLDKLDTWQTIEPGTYAQQEWLGSDSEDDSEGEEGEEADDDDDDDDEGNDDEEGDDDDDDGEEATDQPSAGESPPPPVLQGEAMGEYVMRTQEHWLETQTQKMDVDEQERMKSSDIKQLACALAEAFFSKGSE